MLFVFGALLEYSAVNVMYRVKKQEKRNEAEAASIGMNRIPVSAAILEKLLNIVWCYAYRYRRMDVYVFTICLWCPHRVFCSQCYV